MEFLLLLSQPRNTEISTSRKLFVIHGILHPNYTHTAANKFIVLFIHVAEKIFSLTHLFCQQIWNYDNEAALHQLYNEKE